MKKIFILGFTILSLNACQKEAVTNSSEDIQKNNKGSVGLASKGDVVDKDASATSTTSLSQASSSKGDQLVRIDLTGFQFISNCTQEAYTTLSGTLQFNVAPDGKTIRLANISNWVLKGPDGTIYRGTYVQTFEYEHGTVLNGVEMNNFALTINAQGGGIHEAAHGELHITVNANGVMTAYVDNFTLDCH